MLSSSLLLYKCTLWSLSISNVLSGLYFTMNDVKDDKILLPHHVQLKLCDTRLPYRQGRKLTAVKVYSIATESNHLLIFGVPSLNLSQEIRTLFMKFGNLLQFCISKDHASEPFTETYHAHYEKIQSARIAKRTLDTKNFYGGLLHVCYAPEFESVMETHQKLIHRHNDVIFRLKYLQNEENKSIEETNSNISLNVDETRKCDKNLLDMGQINVIITENGSKSKKRKSNNNVATPKRCKPCFINETSSTSVERAMPTMGNEKSVSSNVKRHLDDVTEVEIVDCTSVEKKTVSNISEALNYNKFGEEVIFKLPVKPVNKIKFNVNKKSLVYIRFYFMHLINMGKKCDKHFENPKNNGLVLLYMKGNHLVCLAYFCNSI